MELSARNQLSGTIIEIQLGAIMAEVTVELTGGQEMVAAITRGSVDRLGLKVGDQVTAIVKATEVMLGK
ncbi:MAG: TOBE domain-containing protein [Ktedonobacterales bacterium]